MLAAGALRTLEEPPCRSAPNGRLRAGHQPRPQSPIPKSWTSRRRFNVSVAGAQLSLLRDLINRPEYEAMDCASLVNWPQAHVACEALARTLALALPLPLYPDR